MSQPGDPFTPSGNDGSGPVHDGTLSADLVAHANVMFTSGAMNGRIVPLLARESVIGRSADAHIVVKDKAISSRHACIVWNGHHHSLVDLGSTNGTYLNGRRIPSGTPIEISPGDSIQVAETVLVYMSGRSLEQGEQTRQLVRIEPLPQGMSTALGMPSRASLAPMLRMEEVAAPPQSAAASLEQQIDTVMRYARIVKQHWVPLLGFATFSALVSVGTVFANPPPSEASCRLRLTPPVSANTLQQSSDQRAEAQFYSTAEQDFSSPTLVRQVLTASKVPATRIDVAHTIDKLKLEGVARGTYEASYTHPDANFAIAFLKRYIDSYIESQIQKTIHVAQAEVDFLSERIKSNEAELRTSEEAIKEFKSQHLDGLPENAQTHMSTRETLFARRAEVAAQYEKSSLELSLARKRLSEAAPLLTKKVEKAAPFDQGIVEVQRKLSEARAKGLGEAHPDIIALEKQLRDLQKMSEQARASTGSELDRDANPGLIELRNRVGDLDVATKAAGAELGEVNAQIKRLNSIVGDMPEVEAKYAELSRAYTSSTEMHAKLAERMRLSQLQLELERSSAKARYEILSPPESFGAPIRRALLIRTVIGLGVGLVIGALFAVLKEFRKFLKDMRQRRAARAAAPGTAIVPVDDKSRSLVPR